MKFNFENKSGVVKNLKMATLVSLGLFFSSGKVFGQNSEEKISDKKLDSNEIVSPQASWVYEEGTDSIIARDQSRVYPGFIEAYMKNNDGKYHFYQYESESGDILNTPEEIQEMIKKEKLDIEKYSNPSWAQKEFEYQQTKEFEDSVVQQYISDMQKRIDEMKFRLENFGDTSTYSKKYRSLDEKDLKTYQGSIEFTEKNPEWIIKEKKKTIEQIKKDADGYILLAQEHIKRLEDQLFKTSKYIEEHKK